MPRTILILLILLILVTASCAEPEPSGPVRIDVIGSAERLRDPLLAEPDRNAALLLANIGQGLVRRDGAGEIEPGLARRWTVLDDGSLIFRLGDFAWNDGTELNASQIARRLRDARHSQSALAPILADIDEINAVTPQILELRIDRPISELLQALAAPALTVYADGEGLGPMAVAEGYHIGDDRLLLAPRRSPPRDDGDEADALPPSPVPSDTVALRFVRAAQAVARFQQGATDIVLGGDWTTLAYAETINPGERLVVEPVIGLFGLAIVEDHGFLGEAQNRRLLSLAIDRGALAIAFGRAEAEPHSAIVPDEANGGGPRAGPPWQRATLAARRGFARVAVERWEEDHDQVPPLRIALPDAAGSRLIFALVQANWAAIGIEAERVPINADADLRLVDRVAPTDQIDWFLDYFHCGRFVCDENYDSALALIAEAETPRVHAIRRAQAAGALDMAAPFIPLLRPIRWSLVGPNVRGFTPNRYASHPFGELVAGTN